MSRYGKSDLSALLGAEAIPTRLFRTCFTLPENIDEAIRSINLPHAQTYRLGKLYHVASPLSAIACAVKSLSCDETTSSFSRAQIEHHVLHDALIVLH